MQNVKPLHLSSDSAEHEDIPMKRKQEDTTEQLLNRIISNNNLSPAKKIEAVGSVIGSIINLEDDSDSKEKKDSGGKKTSIGQWLSILFLALLLAADFLSGFIQQDNKAIVSQLKEIQTSIETQNDTWESNFETLENRFSDIENRLTKMETTITGAIKTDEELAAALSDWIDHQGYKNNDLPDSVRYIMLRNEQKELEKNMNK